MFTRHALLVLSLAFSFAHTISYAQNFDLTSAGARADALGGAFIGVADDATALFWNPAGLAQLRRPEASVVMRSITNRDEDRDSWYSKENTSIRYSHTVPNFASLALPFTAGDSYLVAGIAYQRQIDLEHTLKYQRSVDEEAGGVQSVTPGIAFSFSPMLSIGASANIWTGTFSDVSLSPNVSHTGSFNFTGFNFVFGALLDLEASPVSVPVSVGVCVRTPFDLTADGREQSLASIPWPFLIESSAKITVQMPLMVGGGMMLRLSKEFFLSVDYEKRQYGKRTGTVGSIIIAYDPEWSLLDRNIPLSASGKDLDQLRFGAEYRIALGKFTIPLRAGYRTVPTLSANSNEITGTLSQSVGKAYSFGAGCSRSWFSLDLAYTTADHSEEQTWGMLVVPEVATHTSRTSTLTASLRVSL